MQCTAPHAPQSSVPLSVSPRSLAAAFAHVPDPRRRASVTYALAALLTLAVAAILANHLAVLAIAEWGARQSPDVLRTLGFPDGRTPCQSTLQRLFSKLDGHVLAAALSAHCAPPVVPVPEGDAVHRAGRGRGWQGAAGPSALPGGGLPGAGADRLLPCTRRGAGS